MKKPILAITVLAGCLLLQSAAMADTRLNMFRCDRNVVQKGDPADKVISYCGQPSSVTTIPGASGATQNSYTGKMTTYRSDPGEVWLYNFGRRGSLVEMTFRNGSLISITDKGYGY